MSVKTVCNPDSEMLRQNVAVFFWFIVVIYLINFIDFYKYTLILNLMPVTLVKHSWGGQQKTG